MVNPLSDPALGWRIFGVAVYVAVALVIALGGVAFLPEFVRDTQDWCRETFRGDQ